MLGGSDAVGERFVQPTILIDVPEDSTAITEETFGPTRHRQPGRQTWTRPSRLTNATATASRRGVLQGHGMSHRPPDPLRHDAVNRVIAFAAIPALPFGGVGDSGFGRIHGPDGLKEFTYAKAIARQRFKPVMNLTSFARDAATDGKVAQLITLLHGGKQTLRSTEPPAAHALGSPPCVTDLGERTAAALVFLSSAAVLVVELTALRLLAPYLGLTLETSTMVIGIALAAIAAGSWAGGTYADLVDPRRVLAPLLGVSGAVVAVTPFAVRGAGESATASGAGAVLLVAAVTILVPGALLSAVTPMVTKLQLSSPRPRPGAVVGPAVRHRHRRGDRRARS